jgi:threonine dehydrogenase-like Zn-dependent dehydrogenase
MRQLTFIDAGTLEWQDVPAPVIDNPGEAIVRPFAAATCDLDIALIRGRTPFTGPFAFGHEFVATVTEIGPAVRTVRPGDVVVVPFQISCGDCAACMRGHTASCSGVEPRRSMYGLGAIVGKDWGGAMSDLVRVPHADAMLVPLPANIDPIAVASCSDNLPDAWRTVAPPLEAFPGASVLIVGGGAPSIALYAVAIARALGSEVHYIDNSETRLAIAHDLGATVIEGPPPRKHGRHPVTVDASASVEGLQCAIRSTAGDGVCTSVGIYYVPEVGLPLLEMYTNNITFITGRVSARPAIPRVLELVATAGLHPERVTTSVVAWDEAVSALTQPFTKLVLQRSD